MAAFRLAAATATKNKQTNKKKKHSRRHSSATGETVVENSSSRIQYFLLCSSIVRINCRRIRGWINRFVFGAHWTRNCSTLSKLLQVVQIIRNGSSVMWHCADSVTFLLNTAPDFVWAFRSFPLNKCIYSIQKLRAQQLQQRKSQAPNNSDRNVMEKKRIQIKCENWVFDLVLTSTHDDQFCRTTHTKNSVPFLSSNERKFVFFFLFSFLFERIVKSEKLRGVLTNGFINTSTKVKQNKRPNDQTRRDAK